MKKRKLILIISTVLLSFLFSVAAYSAAAVRINDTRVFLCETDSAQLKLINANQKYKVEWSSSDKSIATVSSSGIVTAKNEGKATIYAKYRNKKYSSTVIVSKYRTEKSLVSLIKKTESSNSWKDGTALKCLNKVPYTVGNITVTEISVKKYHCTGTWYGTQQKYKYILTIKGSISGQDSIGLQFTRSDGASTERRYYTFSTQKGNDVNSKFTKSGKNFTLAVAQYNMWCDYDEFFIYNKALTTSAETTVSQEKVSKNLDIVSCGTDPDNGNFIITFDPSGWDAGVKDSTMFVSVSIDGKCFPVKATVSGKTDADGYATITIFSGELNPADGSVITVSLPAGLVTSKSGNQVSREFITSVEHKTP